MDKRVKWGIIILVGAGLIGLGIHNFTPKENEELNEANQQIPTEKKKSLNVNAQVIKPHLLTDQLFVSGKLMPDEEVDLSFETSGKSSISTLPKVVSFPKDSYWQRSTTDSYRHNWIV